MLEHAHVFTRMPRTATSDYLPPSLPLDIVYQDETLLVLSKPEGLLSVPGRGAAKRDSLSVRVQARHPEARIVHRLDMETSGLMLMARTGDMLRRLGRLFETRQVDKEYTAVVSGRLPSESGRIDLPLICDWPHRPRQKVDFSRGKPACTRYRTLQYNPATDVTRVLLRPQTGRTHQLRVHMLALGHPILGDSLYAPGPSRSGRLLLHASSLSFSHPFTGKRLRLQSPAPF